MCFECFCYFATPLHHVCFFFFLSFFSPVHHSFTFLFYFFFFFFFKWNIGTYIHTVVLSPSFLLDSVSPIPNQYRFHCTVSFSFKIIFKFTFCGTLFAISVHGAHLGEKREANRNISKGKKK